MQLKLQIVSQFFSVGHVYTVSVVALLHACACVKCSADVVCIVITMAYHYVIFLSRAAARLSFYS